MRLEDIIDEAKKEARRSTVKKSKHGAIVVRGGKIIGRGFNRNSPNCGRKQLSIHAEVDAVSNCGNTDLRDAVMFVIRINTKGELRSSEPCKHCREFLIRHNIKNVFYSESPE